MVKQYLKKGLQGRKWSQKKYPINCKRNLYPPNEVEVGIRERTIIN